MKRTLLALVLVAPVAPAFAQAPAAPAAPAGVTVARHSCGEKPEWPGKLASAGQNKQFDKQLKTYGDCVKAYLDERQAAIRTAHAAAKANTDAANAAIAEYNELLAKIRTEQAQ